jgi:hypothetical protein
MDLRLKGGTMTSRIFAYVVAMMVHCSWFVSVAAAHPASGIVVDNEGQVFFIDSGHAVMKIDRQGKLQAIHQIKDGHWMALDAQGAFSRATPRYFQRITGDGVKPALIYAGGGAPLVVNSDGNLYYASGDRDDRPGGLALIQETPDGRRTKFSPALTKALHQIDDGVTGLASGPDGSLYVACWTAVFNAKMDGTVKTLAHSINVKDCDEDKADHNPANRLPFLRGLAVGPDGTVYAAATSCHCVIKITSNGAVETVLKAARPWSPTGLAIHGRDLYVLEYTNANGPATEGWQPRVRKLGPDGVVSTLVTMGADPARKVVAIDLAATTPAAPIPPLNQKVLEFARERMGEKVADGQCMSLAVEALRYAGAKRYPFDPSGDFVWGRPVASFKEALPGDILQFRNAVFQGKRWISRRRWVAWHHEYPHHTAIVLEVRERGRVVAILHQNVGAPDAAEATKQVVQKASIRPESLQAGGAVAIYRPVARDEGEIRRKTP